MAQIESTLGRVRLLTALLLVATFAAGTVTGAGIYRWVDSGHGHPGPPPMPAPIPFEELNLSAEQQDKIHAIFEAHRPELDALIRQAYPKVQAINEQMDREMRAVLTPEQQARFDQIKARRPPQPPPPPPPPGGGPGMGPGQGPGMGPGPGGWPMPIPPPETSR